MTNPDAWISSGFWQLVSKRGLRHDMYYRMGRIESNATLPRDSLNWWVASVVVSMFTSTNLAMSADIEVTRAAGLSKRYKKSLRTVPVNCLGQTLARLKELHGCTTAFPILRDGWPFPKSTLQRRSTGDTSLSLAALVISC